MVERSRIRIDGSGLSCASVISLARRSAGVELAENALATAEQSHRLAADSGTERTVYGRTTGVGANRDSAVDPSAADEHGLRLLRSHAGGTGKPLPDEVVRATLVIRLNQLAAGGSGVHPRILETLETALRLDALPLVHSRGAIGTGDLTALAEIGLTLAGEQLWSSGSLPPIAISPGDALPFISSNAATLGEAVLAWEELNRLLQASHAVAALSFHALGGSAEAYAERVHAARPHSGSVRCAATLRRLLGEELPQGRRIQDPFGLRLFPQVQGPALDAATSLEQVLAVDINAAAENPLIDTETTEIYHHGQFATPYLALTLDHLRAALHHVAELSAARLSDLVEPELTGLSPFLAVGPAGSSGIMILEYVAHDALSQLRHSAAPVMLGSAVISRGLEDHASFSTQAVRSTSATVTAYRTVLGCELLAAVRALRLADDELPPSPARDVLTLAAEQLPLIKEDHPLSDEVQQAERLLDTLADFAAPPPATTE